MAGFFGLFDYSKEGPGVDKNAPKKKGFVVFFEIYFRKFWKLICANLLYVLFTIPILTIGMAQTGSYLYHPKLCSRETRLYLRGFCRHDQEELEAGVRLRHFECDLYVDRDF